MIEKQEIYVVNCRKYMENLKRFIKTILWIIHKHTSTPVQLQRLILKTVFHDRETFLLKRDLHVFATYFRRNLWLSKESYSGFGSQVNTTGTVREKLPVLWQQYQIKSFLDVPCGDYNWMKEVDKQNISYTGGDIVVELIEQNNLKYKTENISFEVIDITQDTLPTVDMIFCKDCLQHLSYENVWKALKIFKNSNSTYLLVTSYPFTLSNWNIYNGDFRPLNLRIKPFNLPAPMLKIREKSNAGKLIEKDKCMYLYKLKDITV